MNPIPPLPPGHPPAAPAAGGLAAGHLLSAASGT
jgi:hypothetical protein